MKSSKIFQEKREQEAMVEFKTTQPELFCERYNLNKLNDETLNRK